MICEEANPLLNLLYDDMLDVKDSARLLEHLKSCTDCSYEWSGFETLKSRIQAARGATIVPADFDKKLAAALEGEYRKTSSSSLKQVAISLAIAMALMVLLLIVARPILNMVQPLPLQASADNLICETVAGVVAETMAERSALEEHTGYEVKMLSFGDWALSSCGVCNAECQTPLVRMDFTNKLDAKENSEKLICYQAPQGTLTSNSPATEIKGKQVRFGEHRDYHYALWSQNGRDYMLITTLPRERFVKLIAGS